MRLWYLRRGVPWAAVIGCLAVAAVLAAAAHRWPSAATVLLPFVVAGGAAAAGFLLDEASAVLVGSTPRGGRWADASRLAVLPPIGLLLLVLVLPAAGAAGLTGRGWAVVCLAAVALGTAVARALRTRWPSPGSQVAALLVLVTALPFTVGALLGWASPWPGEELTGTLAALWVGVGAVAAVVVATGLLRGGPQRRRRSDSMAP